MRLRTTLILLVLGVGAWLLVHFLGEPPRPVTSLAPLVPAELFERWDEIECHLYSKERVKFVRLPGGSVELRFGSDRAGNLTWQYRDVANEQLLKQLIGALQESRRDPFQGAHSENDLLRLGLVDPTYRVIVRAKGKVVDLGFGEEDPAHHGIVARSYGDDELFRTSRNVANVLDHNLDVFRDRSIFALADEAVTDLQVVRYRAESEGGSDIVSLTRDDRDSKIWRLRDPVQMLADSQACLGFVHQACTLSIHRFAGQQFDEGLRKISGLPEHPRAAIVVGAGASVLELEIGQDVGDEATARLKQRDENLCFTIKEADLKKLLELKPDDVRAHRLFPAVESSLVSLTCKSPGGEVRWAVERQAKVVRGAWEITAPFQDLAHAGAGAGSFAQLVADLDRVVALDFLPADAPFTPELALVLEWRNGPILQSCTLEIAGQGDTVHARVSTRPGELFHVPGKLAEIARADLDLYRNRTILPRHDELAPKLVHWKLDWAGGTLELKRDTPNKPATVVAGRPELQSRFEGAASGLFGAQAHGFVRAASVAKSGLDAPLLTLLLETLDGEKYELAIGATAGEDFYGRLARLPPDLLVLVPREALEDLLDLIR